jgi:hypothetical protein
MFIMVYLYGYFNKAGAGLYLLPLLMVKLNILQKASLTMV